MRLDPADRAAVGSFARRQGRAVVATVSASGAPEAALVGIAALDDGTLVFDTERAARKVANVVHRSRVAVVVGTAGDISVQLEGDSFVADGLDRAHFGAAYERQWPGSRVLDADYAVVVVRPDWVRVYDATTAPPHVAESRWTW